jgi:hypothetical protein
LPVEPADDPRAVQVHQVAITQHYKSSFIGDRVNYDFRRPSTRSMDLSPQAAEDFRREVERRNMRRKDAVSLGFVLRRRHVQAAQVSPMRSSNWRMGSNPASLESWPGDGSITSGVPTKSRTSGHAEVIIID